MWTDNKARAEQYTIDLRKHPLQERFVFDKRRFLVWIGGRGSTKTSSAVLHLMRFCGDPRNQGARILIGGPTYNQLEKGTLITFDEWFDRTGLVIEKLNGNYYERRLQHGIVVYFRNAAKPEQFRGHEFAIALLDEAAQMEESSFKLANASCRQRRPDGGHGWYLGQDAKGEDVLGYQTIITTTPRGRNWLFDRFVDAHKREYSQQQLGLYLSTTQQSIDAGFLPKAYIADMGYAPGTPMYEQEVMGEFVTWAGLVFSFDPRRDQLEPYARPDFKRVVGGIDFGNVAPSVIKLIGEDARGGYWDFKEFYQPRCDFHVLLEKAAEWQREFRVGMYYCDSANPELIATLRAGGVNARKATKNPDIATTFINSKMVRGEYQLAPECVFTKMEYETYAYKEELRGDETHITEKVRPGQADHAVNANQYAVLGLSGKSGLGTDGGWVSGTFGVRAPRRRTYRRAA